MNWWFHLSSLGALDVTAPLATGIAAWLACARGARLALAWCLLFVAALALAAASQMAFIGWGWGVQSLAFTGFSGHAMRAAAVLPVALFVVLEKRTDWCSRALLLAGVVVAVGVAVARVKVGAHSPSEAVLGCALGLGTAALFMARARGAHDDLPQPRLWPLLPGVLAATLLLPRAELANSHQWLTAVALALSGHDRIYQRGGWQRAEGPYQPPCAPERVRFNYLCS